MVSIYVVHAAIHAYHVQVLLQDVLYVQVELLGLPHLHVFAQLIITTMGLVLLVFHVITLVQAVQMGIIVHHVI
jgi:hypothetical protein